jgi:hypothetical protein
MAADNSSHSDDSGDPCAHGRIGFEVEAALRLRPRLELLILIGGFIIYTAPLCVIFYVR